MKPTTLDTLDHLIAAACAAGRLIVRDLLIPLLALCITLATLHRERTLPQVPSTTTAPLALPPATTAAMPQLKSLTVAQLRVMARQQGHKALARTGRRAQLLEVLA
jgi:hypothetical protein